MPIVDGVKVSCWPCINGHRATNCKHSGTRLMLPVNRPGRPLLQCPHINTTTCDCPKYTRNTSTKVRVVMPAKGGCNCCPGRTCSRKPTASTSSRISGGSESINNSSCCSSKSTTTSLPVLAPTPSKLISLDSSHLANLPQQTVSPWPTECQNGSSATSFNSSPYMAHSTRSSTQTSVTAPQVDQYQTQSPYTPPAQTITSAFDTPMQIEDSKSRMAPNNTALDCISPLGFNHFDVLAKRTNHISNSNSMVDNVGYFQPQLPYVPVQHMNESMGPNMQYQNLGPAFSGTAIPQFNGSEPIALSPTQGMFNFGQMSLMDGQRTKHPMSTHVPLNVPHQMETYGSFAYPVQHDAWQKSMQLDTSLPARSAHFDSDGEQTLINFADLDNSCTCGPSCTCFMCTSHPYNNTTTNAVYEAYRALQQQQQSAGVESLYTTPNDEFSPLSPTTGSSPVETTGLEDVFSGGHKWYEFDFENVMDVNAADFDKDCIGYELLCPCGDDCTCTGCKVHNPVRNDENGSTSGTPADGLEPGDSSADIKRTSIQARDTREEQSEKSQPPRKKSCCGR